MSLSETIHLRLSLEKKWQYQAQANAQGVSLSTFLRQRLEKEDDLFERLKTQCTLPSDQQDKTRTLHEILLLLRSLAGPDKVKMVQAELNRVPQS